MKVSKLLNRRLIVAALSGLVLFVGASSAHAAWFRRASRAYYPAAQQTAYVRTVPAQTAAAPVNRTYRSYSPRWSQYRSGFPQSSQALYHNLGKWPPY